MKGCASLSLRPSEGQGAGPVCVCQNEDRDPQHPRKKLGAVVPTCKHSTRKAERDGFLELGDSLTR